MPNANYRSMNVLNLCSVNANECEIYIKCYENVCKKFVYFFNTLHFYLYALKTNKYCFFLLVETNYKIHTCFSNTDTNTNTNCVRIYFQNISYI